MTDDDTTRGSTDDDTGDETADAARATLNERAPDGDRSYEAVRDRLRMPLEAAMLTQRAVRRVLPDPVDDDIVLRCVELALKAPTGSNGQNWEFVVVKDRGHQGRLRPAVPTGRGGSTAASGSGSPPGTRRWPRSCAP